MDNLFYLKMAYRNIRKNVSYNVPYLIASMITVMIYFLTLALFYNPGMDNLSASPSIKVGFQVAMRLVVIYAGIFMLYLNSFLLKRRKKEFGLYHIWGMEKRHISCIILLENAILCIVSIVGGILCGVVFGKVMFLLLLKICRQAAGNSEFVLTAKPFIRTLLLFLILYVVTSLINVIQILRAKTIDLLKAEKYGEKKVRFILPMTFLGLGLLSYSYYKANIVDNYISAILQFFGLVAMVILATYLLFTAGSIFLLTLLKKNKRIYYQSNNFVAIAGMFYRMKQNAVGLSNICILSAMVLITVTSCISLYYGEENMIKQHSASDLSINYQADSIDKAAAEVSYVSSEAGKYGIHIQDAYSLPQTTMEVLYKNDALSPIEKDKLDSNIGKYFKDMQTVALLTQEEYKQSMGEEVSLQDSQILVISNKMKKDTKSITIGEEKYDIKQVVSDSKWIDYKYSSTDEFMILIVKEQQEKDHIIQSLGGKSVAEESFQYIMNYEAPDKDAIAFAQQVKTNTDGYVSDIHLERITMYGEFGGLLFIGIFFALLFMASTVLIIYFKQITEGNEDKERFTILQKVGMDDIAVKRTINKQILIVFFMPLLGAVLHTIAARHIVIKCMEAFAMTDIRLITISMAGSSILFALFYFAVYRLTARVYLKIVRR